jgi:hypothetical protein
MKKLLLLILAISIAACGEAAKVENAAQARDAAMDAATAKMVVTRGATVSGHSQVVTLGKVQGRCGTDPEANEVIPSGDNLRQAAFRKYGAQVDAIVSASSVQINNELIQDPGSTSASYTECSGTAVHFADDEQS